VKTTAQWYTQISDVSPIWRFVSRTFHPSQKMGENGEDNVSGVKCLQGKTYYGWNVRAMGDILQAKHQSGETSWHWYTRLYRVQMAPHCSSDVGNVLGPDAAAASKPSSSWTHPFADVLTWTFHCRVHV